MAFLLTSGDWMKDLTINDVRIYKNRYNGKSDANAEDSAWYLTTKRIMLAQLANYLNVMIPVGDTIPPHPEPTKESEKIP